MSAIWRCGVCETVNSGGRLCRACGSELSLTAVASRSAKAVVAPTLPPVTAQQPLPDTVNRAINREEITDEEWHAYDEEEERRISVLPLPGGCLFSVGPRRSSMW